MELEKVFKLFDMSNNGTISKQEILEILRFMLGDHIDTQNLRTGSREYFFFSKNQVELSFATNNSAIADRVMMEANRLCSNRESSSLEIGHVTCVRRL